MARRRRYYRTRTVYRGGGGRSYGRRSYGRRNNTGLNLSTPFLAGLVVGYTNLDDKIPAQLSLAAATAPIRMQGFGKIKALAQGIVFGNLIQSYMNKGGQSTAQFFGI
jgi:hypothetical protein